MGTTARKTLCLRPIKCNSLNKRTHSMPFLLDLVGQEDVIWCYFPEVKKWQIIPGIGIEMGRRAFWDKQGTFHEIAGCSVTYIQCFVHKYYNIINSWSHSILFCFVSLYLTRLFCKHWHFSAEYWRIGYYWNRY